MIHTYNFSTKCGRLPNPNLSTPIYPILLDNPYKLKPFFMPINCRNKWAKKILDLGQDGEVAWRGYLVFCDNLGTVKYFIILKPVCLSCLCPVFLNSLRSLRFLRFVDHTDVTVSLDALLS